VALLCLLPAVVAVVLKVADFPPPSGQGGAFLSAVLRNGALFPAAALALVLPVFLPLAVAVVLSSLVIGVLVFGTGAEAVGQAGAATSLSGVTLGPAELGVRLLGSVGYIVASMIGFGVIALFFSTLTDSGLGAALGALSVLITSSVLETLDAASVIKPFLPTNYWLAWIDFFRDPVFWHSINKGLLLQAGYVVVFFGAAWANFTTKDVTG
jgi:ABC-2 type transport system permease protein